MVGVCSVFLLFLPPPPPFLNLRYHINSNCKFQTDCKFHIVTSRLNLPWPFKTMLLLSKCICPNPFKNIIQCFFLSTTFTEK